MGSPSFVFFDIGLTLLSPRGALFLNATGSSSHPVIDATGLAAAMGSPLIRRAGGGAGLRGGAGFGTAAYSAAKTGYSTGAGVALNDDVRNYGIAKYGLGAVRKLSGMGPLRAVSAPLKSFLGSMGVSL